jgi:hypothetical protein
MVRRKRWEFGEVNDGIGEVRLLSWRYFPDFIYREMLDFTPYIWRGHRCDDWALESTLDRLIKDAKVSATKSARFRHSHLEQFKYAACGRRGPNPVALKEENDWWALGQHYGLATPLLDWTASPFAAAYFAFIGKGKGQTRNRAVVAIHRPGIEDKVRELIAEERRKRDEEKKEISEGRKKGGLLGLAFLDLPIRPQVEFIRPLSDENQRLVNQGGLFTRAPDGITLEDWIRKYFKGHDAYIMLKILIPNKDRENCLKMLNRMNINHLTLFPDLYGASMFCNLFGEIERY